MLSRFEDIPGRYSWHSSYLEDNGTISETEISRGFLNIAEGLQFLHTVQKRLHLSVSPESIVITGGGVWKLCGFGFSLTFEKDDNKITIPYFMGQKGNSSFRLDPDLRYCGPEFTDGVTISSTSIRSVNAASDIFALAVTVYEMYRYNLRLASLGRSNSPLFDLHGNAPIDHCTTITMTLQTVDFTCLPPNLCQLMMGLLQSNAGSRVTVIDVINNPFFHSGPLGVLRSVDNILTRDIGSQAALLASLSGQLSFFAPRIQEIIILPMLCKLTTVNPSMWMYSLPVHVYVASRISTVSYVRIVSESFKTGLLNKESDIMSAFVKYMDHILDRFDIQFFQANVIPMLCNALDKQNALLLQASFV